MSAESDTSRGPDFIIIGAMKCMTSTLHDQLAAQDGVFMTTPKEPFYFSDDEVYARGEAWYRGLFADARPDDLCGESSTHYTKLPTYPHTVERMAAAFPNVKLIYVMRHPLDRLVTQYVHEWAVRRIDCPIASAIERLPELVDYSRYAYQLEPYLRRFGAGNVLPLFHERLVAAPGEEFARIGQFLAVSKPLTWHAEMEARNASREMLRRSPWRDTLVDAPGLSWIRRNFVPRAVRNRIKGFWQMRRKPRLPGDVRQRLKAVFDEDLRCLGDWLGTPLACDTFGEVVIREPLQWQPDLDHRLVSTPGAREVLA